MRRLGVCYCFAPKPGEMAQMGELGRRMRLAVVSVLSWVGKQRDGRFEADILRSRAWGARTRRLITALRTINRA